LTARRVVPLLLRFGFVLLFIAVGLEIGLRVLEPRHDGIRRLLYLSSLEQNYDDLGTLPELMERSILGFRPRTAYSGYVLNSRSLRTPEYTTAKQESATRIVVLGDSFAFASGGIPFSDHWVSLLGARLEEEAGTPFEMVNLGVPGVGPLFERRMWQLEGASLNADLVVLALFVGNDLTTEHGALVTGELNGQPFQRLVHASHLVRAVRNAWRLSGSVEAGASEPPQPREIGGVEIAEYRSVYDDLAPTFSEDVFLDLEAHLMSFHQKYYQPRFGWLIDKVCATVAGLQSDVRAAGAELCVVLIPDSFQVDRDLRRTLIDRLGGRSGGADAFDLEFAQRRLVAFMEQQGIDVIDLLPAFRSEAASHSLYRVRDTHWNKPGNRLAAHLVADHILDSFPNLGGR